MVDGRWFIGQKVICVDGSFHQGVWDWCVSVPVEGIIYTIRRIQLGPDPYTQHYGVGFLLEEIVNPRTGEGREGGFFSGRFRPLSEAAEFAAHNAQSENLTNLFRPCSLSYNG